MQRYFPQAYKKPQAPKIKLFFDDPQNYIYSSGNHGGMECTKVDSSCSASESESELISSTSVHSEASCPLFLLFLLIPCSLPSVHFDSVVVHCHRKSFLDTMWMYQSTAENWIQVCELFHYISDPLPEEPLQKLTGYPLLGALRGPPLYLLPKPFVLCQMKSLLFLRVH